MSTVGIITEYNPFHNGHLYHIQKAREVTGADTVIAVMSGDFVQRGEPAFMDKHSRAFLALSNGVNLIAQLPVFYSCSSAETFSYGAVMTLKELGADYICFGSECGDLSLLSELADLFLKEPLEFSNQMKAFMSQGISYPLARSKALISYLEQSGRSSKVSQISKILSSPNNILGIEYLKVIQKHHLSMKPVTIKRIQSNYHDTEIYNSMPSASAIRDAMLTAQKEDISNTKLFETLQKSMPKNAFSILNEQFLKTFPIIQDDFSLHFNIKFKNIIYNSPEILTDYVDINTAFANRLRKLFTGFDSISAFAMKLKSKQTAYSRISRCLFHIILEITREKAEKFDNSPSVPYVRILGLDACGQRQLAKIKRNGQVPVIIKTADYKDFLQEDLFASDLYRMAVYQKYNVQMPSDLKCPPIILK